jgi:hypothetical protein
MPWSFKAGAILAIAAIASVGSAQKPPEAMFTDRAVNVAARRKDVPQPVQEQYYAIESKRSLLIPLCVFADKEICPPAFQQSYSLQNLFRTAATLAAQDPEAAGGQWFQQATAGGLTPLPISSLTQENIWTSFQLIAVVNRMDLAVWCPRTGKWSGSELRFIYGYLPDGFKPGEDARCTLILELVLPDADWPAFRDQAGRWKDLMAAKTPVASLEKALTDVIEHTGYNNATTTRIRANCLANGAFWRFSEWVFQSAAGSSPGTFDQTGLDFQINKCYTTWPATTPLCKDVATQAKFDAYVALWKGPPSDGKTPIPITGLSTTTADYSAGGRSLAPPASIPDTGQSRTKRNVIALQQCTGCHASETGTDLQHVSETGSISNFLLPGGKWVVDLDSLRKTKPAFVSYCAAMTTSAIPSGGGTAVCADGTRKVIVKRIFHDLARRKLFMASVLAAPANAPRPCDVEYIMDYAPDFAH